MAGAKGKPRRKQRLKPDNPAQSAKFIKAARKLGLGGKGDDFDRAMDKLVPKGRKRP
jgi:hypothetical protein